MKDEFLKDIALCFGELDARLKVFKKNTYAEAFHGYMEENQEFFTEMNRCLAGQEEGFADAFSDAVVAYAAQEMEAEKRKVKRENRQISLNMFMVVYFLPAILEGKQAGAQELADEICRKWAERFKGSHIRSANFASIAEGFRSKLCYITTAAVRSLHKPEDCYELELLRDYRDNCLLQTAEGTELVERYYNIAPTIVKRIGKSADAEEKYRYIWDNYLQPCICAIENGDTEECGRVYTGMVEELQEQYMFSYRKNDPDC